MASFSYLLDTNIISDLVHEPQGRVMRRIAQVGEERVCTGIIVASELWFGAEKKASERLTRQLEKILAVLVVLPFETPAERQYGQLRAHLQKKGQLIGGNDLLIAAHALSLKLTLVTADEREFSRVPGLSVENWLSR